MPLVFSSVLSVYYIAAEIKLLTAYNQVKNWLQQITKWKQRFQKNYKRRRQAKRRRGAPPFAPFSGGTAAGGCE
ncbi:hypothetical protein HMPREF0262_03599 [Clostridium sp. ATCC 29733]|nr:hypothetical protein HMPREF0262_03599 [Clostridium sp. ATCC 29733]